MLPGDYSRKIKYESLDNAPKRLRRGSNDKLKLLTFPEDLQGEQFQERPFLVFYFDDEADYATVREYFECPTHHAVSHPELDAQRLAELVRAAQGDPDEE